MDDWKAVSAIPNFNRTQKAKMMLSRETDEGLHISGIYTMYNLSLSIQ